MVDLNNWHSAPVPWTPWPHQAKAVERLTTQFFEKDQRRLLCACPTGGGKTIIAIEMIREAARRNLRCMFLAPRYELIDQVCKKLDTFAAFSYGKIVADPGVPRSTYAPLQVASLDTLVSRIIKRKNLILPPIDFVVMDEAHLYITDLRVALGNAFGPDCKILGLSATPGRHDGTGLSAMFDHIIRVSTVKELTEQGFLAPGQYYAPTDIDMARIKIARGEYNKQQVAERIEPLLGDIPGQWMELGGQDRRTCVFAQNVGQSVFLAEKFRALGVAAEHADGSMDPDMRRDIFDRFRSGETQVLTNCDLATYGFDLPEMAHVILACRDRSVVRYLQKIGRAARAAKGKAYFVVQDHAGNWHEHGRHDEERFWDLQGYNPKTRKGRKPGTRARNITQLVCPECDHVFSGALTCPQCKYFFEAAAKKFRVIEGELAEIAKDINQAKVVSEIERRRFYCEVMGYWRNRNANNPPEKHWRQGWVDHTYKARFKILPPKDWVMMQPMTPTLNTQRWIKHHLIRRSKEWQAEKRQRQAS